MSKWNLTCLRSSCSNSTPKQTKFALSCKHMVDWKSDILCKNCASQVWSVIPEAFLLDFCGVQRRYATKSASFYSRSSIVLQDFRDFDTSEIHFIMQIMFGSCKKVSRGSLLSETICLHWVNFNLHWNCSRENCSINTNENLQFR